VLIVDDNAGFRAAARASLSALGHEVREADDISDAVAIVARERPDFVLLDIFLGRGKVGPNYLSALRATSFETAVVVVSSIEQSLGRYLEADAIGHKGTVNGSWLGALLTEADRARQRRVANAQDFLAASEYERVRDSWRACAAFLFRAEAERADVAVLGASPDAAAYFEACLRARTPAGELFDASLHAPAALAGMKLDEKLTLAIVGPSLVSEEVDLSLRLASETRRADVIASRAKMPLRIALIREGREPVEEYRPFVFPMSSSGSPEHGGGSPQPAAGSTPTTSNVVGASSSAAGVGTSGASNPTSAGGQTGYRRALKNTEHNVAALLNMVATLKQHGGPVTQKALAKLAGIAPSTLNEMLNQGEHFKAVKDALTKALEDD
jgi:CheY-like chemotaxis protein